MAPYIEHRAAVADPGAAFKMEDKAAVIHIYGTDSSYFIIRNKKL